MSYFSSFFCFCLPCRKNADWRSSNNRNLSAFQIIMETEISSFFLHKITFFWENQFSSQTRFCEQKKWIKNDFFILFSIWWKVRQAFCFLHCLRLLSSLFVFLPFIQKLLKNISFNTFCIYFEEFCFCLPFIQNFLKLISINIVTS